MNSILVFVFHPARTIALGDHALSTGHARVLVCESDAPCALRSVKSAARGGKTVERERKAKIARNSSRKGGQNINI